MPWPALSMFAESCITSVSISGSCIPSVVTNSQHNSPNLRPSCTVYKNVYSQVLQHVLGRVDQAFKNFLRSGFGFPRFKGANRFDSFTYPQTGFSLGGGQLTLAKIGNVKVRLSRPLPHGAVVKTCTMKRFAHGWFATLVIEHQPVPLPANDLAVGIDVGVTSFAKFSDGTNSEPANLPEYAGGTPQSAASCSQRQEGQPPERQGSPAARKGSPGHQPSQE